MPEAWLHLLETIGAVALAALVLGGGLPVLFALGLRAWAWGRCEAATSAPGAAGGPTAGVATGGAAAAHPVGLVAGALCFALVVLAVVLGIVFVVASGMGYDLVLTGGVPGFVKG